MIKVIKGQCQILGHPIVVVVKKCFNFRWILKPFMYFPIDPTHGKKYRLIRRRLMVNEHDQGWTAGYQTC